jgi:hypothetical protein
LWTFGSPDSHGLFETAVLDTAAMAGLITVTLQIACLPHLPMRQTRCLTAVRRHAPSVNAADRLPAVGGAFRGG